MTPQIRHNSTLSPVQAQVVLALASGQTISAAARAADIHRSTIHNWLNHDAAFRAEFDIIRQERIHEISDQLHELEAAALDTIRQLLDDPKTPASVRLKAALAVLERPGWYLAIGHTPPPLQQSRQTSQPSQPAITHQDPPQDTPRNAPCPCGSGSKYKRCCGQNAPPVLMAA